MPSPNDYQDQATQPMFPTPGRTDWTKEIGAMPSRPLHPSQTSARLPTVIPAAKKRVKTVVLAQTVQTRPHRHMAWPAVLIVGSLVIVLTFAFAVPLSNSQQKSVTLVQGISNLIASGQFGGNVNAAQNGDGTPILNINEPCGGTDIWGTCAKALMDNGTVGTGSFQRPIIGAVITQVFANPEYQTWCNCVRPHTGIDLAAPYGTNITAADTGEVIWVGWDWSGLGWAVKISHGNYMATIYGHMANYTVKVGQYVTKGQVIGHEGSTGASTGPHVHFMVLTHNVWVNPVAYMTLP